MMRLQEDRQTIEIYKKRWLLCHPVHASVIIFKKYFIYSFNWVWYSVIIWTDLRLKWGHFVLIDVHSLDISRRSYTLFNPSGLYKYKYKRYNLFKGINDGSVLELSLGNRKSRLQVQFTSVHSHHFSNIFPNIRRSNFGFSLIIYW